jgi:ATP-binding cassette subfamily B protein
MKPGVITAFLQYFTMILNAMLGVTRVFVMWSKAEASANRIGQVMNMEEDLAVLPLEENLPENAPHIEFDNVTFSYTGVGTNTENLSFRLERGQTLGVLGPTGSGKSTILKLLLRLYDPDKGVVRIDGQDIRTIPYDRLRQKFGVVFQNDFVMEGSIADNIRFFRDLSDEAVAAAAESAQASFIAQKEGGMEAEVQVRGNNLSGGQKQRLLIARALAGDPDILILDDSSSALDYRTDSELRKALRKNYRNTTTVLIAQRVSSLRHADLILVLDDGEVIGAGNHEQLMDSCNEYRTIAEIQMGEGKEGA